MICEWCHEETERPHLDRLACVGALIKKIKRLEHEFSQDLEARNASDLHRLDGAPVEYLVKLNGESAWTQNERVDDDE